MCIYNHLLDLVGLLLNNLVSLDNMNGVLKTFMYAMLSTVVKHMSFF